MERENSIDKLTGRELWGREERLKHDAALQLGFMIFALSRLDVNLGLCLVWAERELGFEKSTAAIETLSMSAKLERLQKLVDERLPQKSKERKAYRDWIRRADTMRHLRNKLIHGRWGVEAPINKVVNVVGLPTSEKQTSTRYDIDELVVLYARDLLTNLRAFD